MTTLVGIQTDAVDLTWALIRLNTHCMQTYLAALPHFDDRSTRQHCHDALEDHAVHIRALRCLVHRLGGLQPEAWQVADPASGVLSLQGSSGLGMEQGRRQITGRSVVQAVWRCERDATAAYARIARRHDLDGEVLLLAERHLADEHAHAAWLQSAAAQCLSFTSSPRWNAAAD
jgi:hypothetical protein